MNSEVSSVEQKSLDSGNQEDFMTSIIEGRDFDGVHSKPLRDMMADCLCADEVDLKLVYAKNHLERVALVEKDFPTDKFHHVLRGLAKQFAKNAEISNLLEQKRLMATTRTEYEKILRFHTLAILFAPTNSQCLAQKYGKRARFFYSERISEFCLADIQLAFSQDCPVELIEQLVRLETECVTMAQNQKQHDRISTDTMKLRSYRDDIVYNLKGNRNEQIPSAIEGIQIKFDDRRERHIITDRHLAPGTTVIVEQPFVKSLINLAKWDTRHCYKCLVKIEQGIPCPDCVFVIYCSDVCRLADLQGGHSYECPCLPLLHASKICGTQLLAFKILCKEGPTSLYNCWNEDKSEQDQRASTTNLIPGFNPKTGSYDSDSYYQVRHMKGHFNENMISLITWHAVTVTKALDYLTPFFHDYNQDEFKLYVANQFVTQAMSSLCNAVGLTEDARGETREVAGLTFSHSIEVASALYPVISMMSHSCDSNVIRQNLPTGKMAIITRRELNPGDELCLSYGFEFLIHKRNKRLPMIEGYYHFPCKCAPCTLDWPVFEEMDPARTFLCPNCSNNFKWSPVLQTQLCILPPPASANVSICLNCNHSVQIHELMNMANQTSTRITRAVILMNTRKPIEAIPLIVDSIAKFQSLLRAPSKETINAEILLAEAFVMINNA